MNKIYILAQKLDVLKYAGRHSARHFGTPCTTVRGWKSLDQQQRNTISQSKNKAGAGCPLSYSEYLDKELCHWVLKCMICICQPKKAHTEKGNRPNPTNTSYFQSICCVVGQKFVVLGHSKHCHMCVVLKEMALPFSTTNYT